MTRLRDDPVPAYDVWASPAGFNDLLDWMNGLQHERCIVNHAGRSFVFESPRERAQWVNGFAAGWVEMLKAPVDDRAPPTREQRLAAALARMPDLSIEKAILRAAELSCGGILHGLSDSGLIALLEELADAKGDVIAALEKRRLCEGGK